MPKQFLVSNAVKAYSNALTKRGFAGLSFRDQKLLNRLAQANLLTSNLVIHSMADYGITQSANAVSSWLNLAPSAVTLNKNLEQATLANRPTWLQHVDGTAGHYGYLNGVAGNYFSAPDSAALSITGDIDIRVRVAFADWTPAAESSLVFKASASGNRSYGISLLTSGLLNFNYSASGSTTNNATSSVAPTVADGASIWVRATREAATGDVIFYTAPDSSSAPTTWVKLGTTISTTAGAIFDNNAALEIGSAFVGTATPANARFFRAQIYNGIAGTLAFDFNPATYTNGTTFVDSSVNAAVISLNGGSVICTASALYFDGVNDFMATGGFTLVQPETVYLVLKQATWTVADCVYDGSATNSMLLEQYAAGASPQLAQYAGSYAGIVSFALQTGGVVTAIFNGAASSLRLNQNSASSGSVGTTNGGAFTLGTRADGARASNITVSEVLVFNTAHDTATQNTVIQYLQDRNGL